MKTDDTTVSPGKMSKEGARERKVACHFDGLSHHFKAVKRGGWILCPAKSRVIPVSQLAK